MGVVNPYRRIAAAGTAARQPVKASQPDQPDRVHAHKVEHFTNPDQERSHDPDGNFNPVAFGGNQHRDGIRQAVGSTKLSNRMFDKKGELNAQSDDDALQQIAYLLNTVTKKAAPGQFYREASTEMPAEDRRKVLAAAMQDPTGEGFAIVGQELLLPIKDIIDYEGWARKVYRVRPLAQGELFRIAKDVRSTAWVVGQDGQSIESRLHGRFIQPSEFKVTAFPTVDIEDIYQMNYDVLDRAQDTARQEIELEEDKRGLALLDRAAVTVNSETIFATLGISAFEDVRYQVERHRLMVEKFLINRAELSDIVKTMSAAVDPVTERELILAGYIGNILNAQIITAAGTGVEEVVPAGTFYAVTGSEYLGEMGVRVELFSEPFNMFSHRRLVKGWAFGEIIGFGIPNPRSVSKGRK
ncbi:hypothetical protein KAR91_59525 [Candidatus Pacearchaeota archaeon]|nr:hypothetical protein [Candidatus Pacearchaeota archaeon]